MMPTVDQLVKLFTPIFGTVFIIMQIMQTKLLTKVKKVAVATHTLTNSATGAMLQAGLDDAMASSVLSHKLAELTNDPGYMAAATAADIKIVQRRKLLQDHLIQQATVDAQLVKEKTA